VQQMAHALLHDLCNVLCDIPVWSISSVQHRDEDGKYVTQEI
jgi:hypothetical protein